MGHSRDPSLNAADIETLKARARALKIRLERLEQKVWCLQAPGMRRARTAVVDSNLCVGCGQCTDVCPTQAIELKNKTARVDASRCRGCGLCADACPRGAVTLLALRLRRTEIRKQATA